MISRFRAWDVELKSMKEVTDIDYRLECVELSDSDGDTYIQGFNNIKLMQSTGLTDKDGKEIFEGDVLCDGGFEQEDEFVYVTVSYKDGMWICYQITNDDFGYGGALNEFAEDYFVIGNIYQNKELLEVQT